MLFEELRRGDSNRGLHSKPQAGCAKYLASLQERLILPNGILGELAGRAMHGKARWSKLVLATNGRCQGMSCLMPGQATRLQLQRKVAL